MENGISILLPYQQRWIADRSEVKIAEKSRRIGLTWSEAVDDVLLAASRNGMDVYYISYNFEFTKEFIQTCKSWARLLNEAASEIQEEIIKDENDEFTCSKITFPSGFKIMGLPARATTIRGRQGKVVIDEAAFCENLSELLKAALAMLLWGGRVCIISTHNGVDNLFNETIREVQNGKKPYSLHRTTITDALADGLYKRICERKKEPWSQEKEDAWLDELIRFYGEGAPEELFCIPARGGARYFSSALVESCQNEDIPVIRYEQTDEFTFFPKEERDKQTDSWIRDNLLPLILIANQSNCGTYIGEDFARSGDLTVIVIAQKDSELTRKTICNIELRNVPFDQQHRILRYILDNTDHVWGASLDARGNGQMLAEQLQQEYGVNTVNSVMITNAFYLQYMPILKARFEDKAILIPKSADIIDDFRIVEQIKGIPKIPDLRTAEKTAGRKLRHGDTVVAELMVEHAINNDTGYEEYEYIPAKEPNRYDYKDEDEEDPWD